MRAMWSHARRRLRKAMMGFGSRRRGFVLPGIVLVGLAIFLAAPASAGPNGAHAGLYVPPQGSAADLASAHGTSPQPHGSDSRSAGVAVVVGVIVASLRLGRVRGRPGRLAALALVLLLSVISVETAVHSVHHLSDPRSAASCQVFSGAQHVPGAVTVHADLVAPRLIVTGPLPHASDTTPPDRFARPDEGRAPPASPSA
jgi:hypothetical protein